MTTCPLCGGDVGLLGALGWMEWYVCRGCGMQFGKKTKPRKKKASRATKTN